LRALNNLELQRVPEPWPELYFFQAAAGYQTYHFHPNVYVDITPYRQRKRDAVLCHASVNVGNSYPIFETVNKTRGYESGSSYAEAFIRIPFRRGAIRDNVVGEGRERA
jgi:LmbE family N-acetylglucosaminyl deacetylase